MVGCFLPLRPVGLPSPAGAPRGGPGYLIGPHTVLKT